MGVKMCPKNVIQNRAPRCTSVTHETPILKIRALIKYNSVLWRGYGRMITNQSTKINTGPLYLYSRDSNKGSEIRTGPLYCSIVGTVIIIKAVISILRHYTIV